MIITLKRADTCRDCGAELKAGSKANWYRNGAVYGIGCHSTGHEPLGLRLSRRDPKGLYAADGRMIGRVRCNHEDYPCCGC